MIPGRLTSAFIAAAALIAAHSPAMAQDNPDGRNTSYTGIALKANLVETGPWVIVEESSTGPVEYRFEEAAGVGLNLSYALRPRLALFAAADLSLYGDLSGYTTLFGGAEYRLPLTARILVSAGAGLGRYVASSNTSFTVGVVDGGIEFFVLRRLSLGAGIQFVRALGTGRRETKVEPPVDIPPVEATLESTLRRTRVGLHWYLGKRN